MPCSSSEGMGQGDGPDYDARKRLDMVEAILCAVLRATDGFDDHIEGLFDKVDWDRAGVNRIDALRWWHTHLKRDEAEGR